MNDERDTGPGPGESPQGPPTRKLLEEIAALAARALPAESFLAELLPRAVAVLQAEAGAVWMIDPERRLVLECEHGLLQTGFLNDPMMKAAFEQPFTLAIERGAVLSHASHQENLDGKGRLFSVLLGGLRRGPQPAGLFQIIEHVDAAPAEQPQRKELLERICTYASKYLTHVAGLPPLGAAEPPGPPTSSTTGVPASPAGGPPVTTPSSPPQVLRAPSPGAASGAPAAEFPPLDGLLSLYDHRRVRDVALVAANESRRWLEVDRVSVAERIGKRLRLQAVSGAASVNPRSNAVQLLTSLTDKVLLSGERLVFDGEQRALPPSLETPLADYLHESRSRAVVIVPLVDPIAWKKYEEAGVRAEKSQVPRPQPLGALVLEQISEAPFPSDLDARIDRVAIHTGLALRNAQAEERVFLLPLWKALGRYTSWFRGRRLAQWSAGLVGVLAIAALLTFFPWDYRVEGKGKMMPERRHNVFAAHDGEVDDVIVKTGATVRVGDLLVQLKNQELDSKLIASGNLLSEKTSQRISLEAQLAQRDPARTKAQELEMRFKILQLNVEIVGLESQVDNLTAQVESLKITAPISGTVVTFRVEELLRGRPVKRGDMLMEIMDPEGPWRLELDVPEERLGHLLLAQKKTGEELPLRYVLATNTEETWEGTLEQLGTRSMVSEKEGAVVPVYADPGDPIPPNRGIGAEVIAKINCGKRALGYVLFGDVIDFLRKRLWL